VDFARQVFGIPAEQLRKTPAYRHHAELPQEEGDLLFIARVLAYAPATWSKHASAFKEFFNFCTVREIETVDCTPMTVNLFLLHLAQLGKSIQVVESAIATISFVLRFYMLRDITTDPMIDATHRFVTKVCPKKSNLKAPFGSYEVRKMWDYLDAKYKDISLVPFKELRTFVLAVIQFNSFCRFSDLAVVKLDDLVFDIDYFKIHIQVSKTDQAGSGQSAYVIKSVDQARDAHMLMCIYIHRLHCFDVPNLYLFPPLK
jgi:hypothetical protein